MTITITTRSLGKGWWQADYDLRYTRPRGSGYWGYAQARTKTVARRKAMAAALHRVERDLLRADSRLRMPDKASIAEAQ